MSSLRCRMYVQRSPREIGGNRNVGTGFNGISPQQIFVVPMFMALLALVTAVFGLQVIIAGVAGSGGLRVLLGAAALLFLTAGISPLGVNSPSKSAISSQRTRVSQRHTLTVDPWHVRLVREIRSMSSHIR